MANAEKNFDQYFREKLIDHKEKPSTLAWERLEGQLNQKRKPVAVPVWRIAAAIILLMGFGYFFWERTLTSELNSEGLLTGSSLADHKDEAIEKEPYGSSELIDLNETIAQESPVKTLSIEKKETKVIPTEAKTEIIAKEDVKEATYRENFLAVEVPEIISDEILEIQIPELIIPELEKSLAGIEESQFEEKPTVEYTITIISKGLKDEPQKSGLVGGLEERVEKIGGLFTKVEQGVAGLQEAKNLIFANNTPKKEKSKKTED